MVLWQEMSFIIKDANVIDYNRIDWSDSYYTDGTYRWVHKCGYNGKSGGKYDYFFEENWNKISPRISKKIDKEIQKFLDAGILVIRNNNKLAIDDDKADDYNWSRTMEEFQ